MVADALEDALYTLTEHRDAPEFEAVTAAAQAGDAAAVLAWLEAKGLSSRFDDLVEVLGRDHPEVVLELALPGVVFAGDVRVRSSHTSGSGRARGAWRKRELGDLDIDLWFGWPGALVTVFTAAGARALGRLAAADRARIVGLELCFCTGPEPVASDVAGLAEGAWPALRRLSLLGSAAQSIAAELIGHSPELVELDPGGPLSTAAIDKLAAAQMLRSLELYDPADDDLARLAVLPRVSSLRIDASRARRMTQHGVHHLARWPALRELRAGGAIGDPELAALATVRGLERLMLLGSKVSDVGGPALARLDRLRELGLSYAQVGDATAAALAAVPALEALCLTSTRVGPAGILALARAPRLRRLGLSWDCGDAVSAAAKQAFAPSTIHWSDYYTGDGMFTPTSLP